jgi:uncharacterized membrane protein
MTRTRGIVVGVVLVVAIVIGILYGYVAGVAVALVVPTVLLLAFGWRFWVEGEGRDPVARYWEEEGFGSDAAKRREH